MDPRPPKFPSLEPARVVMHLNGGFTKVIFERLIGNGHVTGEPAWDIPTVCIPLHLRAINSRFLLTMQPEQPESADAAARQGFLVEEIA